MAITTIAVSKKLKRELDRLKIHPREPYADVISRLIKHYQKTKQKERPK